MSFHSWSSYNTEAGSCQSLSAITIALKQHFTIFVETIKSDKRMIVISAKFNFKRWRGILRKWLLLETESIFPPPFVSACSWLQQYALYTFYMCMYVHHKWIRLLFCPCITKEEYFTTFLFFHSWLEQWCRFALSFWLTNNFPTWTSL
jgi:hypothetical protein